MHALVPVFLLAVAVAVAAVAAVGSRPDVAVLASPAISFVEPFTHEGSKTNLLGQHPDPALARSLSSEKQVTASTPPSFIYHTDADTVVSVENAVASFLALRNAGVLANWLRVSGSLK